MERARVCARLIYVLLCTCQTAGLSGPPSPNRHRNATAVVGPLCRPPDPRYTSGTTEHSEAGIGGVRWSRRKRRMRMTGGGGSVLSFFHLHSKEIRPLCPLPSISVFSFSSLPFSCLTLTSGQRPLFFHPKKLHFTTSVHSRRNNLTGAFTLNSCQLCDPDLAGKSTVCLFVCPLLEGQRNQEKNCDQIPSAPHYEKYFSNHLNQVFLLHM